MSGGPKRSLYQAMRRFEKINFFLDQPPEMLDSKRTVVFGGQMDTLDNEDEIIKEEGLEFDEESVLERLERVGGEESRKIVDGVDESVVDVTDIDKLPSTKHVQRWFDVLLRDCQTFLKSGDEEAVAFAKRVGEEQDFIAQLLRQRADNEEVEKIAFRGKDAIARLNNAAEKGRPDVCAKYAERLVDIVETLKSCHPTNPNAMLFVRTAEEAMRKAAVEAPKQNARKVAARRALVEKVRRERDDAMKVTRDTAAALRKEIDDMAVPK